MQTKSQKLRPKTTMKLRPIYDVGNSRVLALSLSFRNTRYSKWNTCESLCSWQASCLEIEFPAHVQSGPTPIDLVQLLARSKTYFRLVLCVENTRR